MLPRLIPVLLLCGCSSIMADDDGRAFGEDLGRFSVDATMTESTCGPGALSSPEQWEFDVVLSRNPGELYWNSGAASVFGKLERDGVTFSFDSMSTIDVDLRTGPECVMLRHDIASGQLDSFVEVRAFDGTLGYAFEAAEGTDCSALIGVSGGFTALPCRIDYSMTAVRTQEPTRR